MNTSSCKAFRFTMGVLTTVLVPMLLCATPAAAKTTKRRVVKPKVAKPAQPTAAKPTAPKPGVAQPTTYNAKLLLQNTINRYGALNSLRVRVKEQTATTVEGETQSETEMRTLVYAKPNKIHLAAVSSDETTSTVSDGKTLVEYSSEGGANAHQMDAPASLAGVGGLAIIPLFLNVEAQAPVLPPTLTVKAKSDTMIGTVPCRVVGFVAGSFGNMQIAIGKTDGLIYRISYDLAPVLAAAKGEEGTPQKVLVTETYITPQTNANAKVTDADFLTTLPAGITLAAEDEEKEPGPPVPIGQMAPDFSVTPIGATEPVKLSSFKGQVVLLDFWATWCPPCRKSLPETNRLNATYGGKGLKVLAISDEEIATINPFITQNKYTFPVYVDAKGEANKTYGIQAIPTFAIIDKEGKLAAFFVGLPDDGAVEAALKKAGLGTP